MKFRKLTFLLSMVVVATLLAGVKAVEVRIRALK